MAAAPTFAIVAGESSSDTLAAGLILQLRHHWPDARFIGVTGPAMRAAGCDSLADINDLSLFGIGEVVAQLPRLLRFRARLEHDINAAYPSVFIGVDAPALNLGLAGRFKLRGVDTVQYVAPTAWAWHQGRTRKIRRAVDLLLVIFPFEPAFFAHFGINARFVGHPLKDRYDGYDNKHTARAALDLTAEAKVVAVLPGSRRGEVERLAPRFIAAVRRVMEAHGALTLVIPVAHSGLWQLLQQVVSNAQRPEQERLDVRLIAGDASTVLRAADVALVASGTATLEAVMADTPQVVAYRVSFINGLIVRLFRLIHTPFVSMPNLLAGFAVVPEYLQGAASVAALAKALGDLLDDPSRADEQRRMFAAIRDKLGGETDQRAAEAVVELVEAHQSNRPSP